MSTYKYHHTQTRLLLTHIIQIMFASHLFIQHAYELGPCEGPSMLPTLHETGDFILVEKWTHLSRRGYKTGDIVHGRHPYELHPVCKRIAGKGGDVIRVGEGGGKYVQVPRGHVWLEGDNTLSSNDSRFYGPVPEASLKGRVLARVITAKRLLI